MRRPGSYRSVLSRGLAAAALAAAVSCLAASTTFGAVSGDTEARIGWIEAGVVSGKRFESREGRSKIDLAFNRDGSLEADVPGLGEFTGLWWVDPAGRLCLVGNYWAGGACFEALIDSEGRLIGVREAGGSATISITAKGAAR